MSLAIKGFIETSFLDWDGKLVSTIFLPHCNLRCSFCHNSGLVENPDSFETVPISRIVNYLLKHRDFIDGICLTGGEPCLHKDQGLLEFMQQIKDLRFQIKIDTNGTDPDCLKKIIKQKLVDYIAMDLKGPLDERYDKLARVKTDLNKVKQSIKLIVESEIPYEFRTTVVPTLLDQEAVEDIVKNIPGAKKFVLQQFVANNTWDESLRGIKPYAREKLEEMVEAAKKYVAATSLRGV